MKPDLSAAFNDLQKTYPDLTAGTVPLGVGYGGLVIRENDTAIKFLTRQVLEEDQLQAENILHNEISFMRLMEDVSLGDVKTPVLLEGPTPLHDQHYFSTYRMSIIPGVAGSWSFYTEGETTPAEFYNAGKLLAQFHEASSGFPRDNLSHNDHLFSSDTIRQVPLLDAAFNQALEKADQYLQANKKTAVIHGDYHGGNITTDGNGKIIGLYDFGSSGIVSNHIADFRNVPPSALPDFIKGYEDQSGTTIDPLMVSMTEISLLSHRLNKNDPASSTFTEGLKELKDHMNKVRSVTGFVPPGMK